MRKKIELTSRHVDYMAFDINYDTLDSAVMSYIKHIDPSLDFWMEEEKEITIELNPFNL